MRIKTLTAYNFRTIRRAIVIFYAFYMGGTLFGSVISSIAQGTTVYGVVGVENGVEQSWSIGITAFMIFMLISSLIGSQKEARFLITRSVSRKEIFLSNALFMLPLAGILAALQICGIYIDGALRSLLTGSAIRGVALDIQSFQSPNSKNILVFFLVSVSMLLSTGALSYLFGSCMARWKIPTIGVLFVATLTFFSCLLLPGFLQWVIDAFRYMFTDAKSGLWIALKHIVLAAAILLVSFPVMRRITATKQS